MKIDQSDIQQLLRQRRDQLPSEEYFEDFLLEFQRRQRSEMLRRPAWDILWDRANIWLDGFRVPAMAYATIVALAVGVTGMILSSGGEEPAQIAVATPIAAPAALTPIGSTNLPVARVSTNLPPSYVLEPRPISNDRPFSF